LPVSLDHATLCAELDIGRIIQGETNIDIPKHDPSARILRLFLQPQASIYEKAAQAIKEADLVIFTPGDLYTSLIPNLVVHGMKEALQQSKAKMLGVLNLMTKPGETHGFTASRFAEEILHYAGLPSFDCLLVHNRRLNDEYRQRYEAEGKVEVVIDDAVLTRAKQIIFHDLVKESDVVRHDSEKLGTIISKLIV